MFLKAFFKLQFWLDEIKALDKQVQLVWYVVLLFATLVLVIYFAFILWLIESERPSPELLYGFLAYVEGQSLS